MAYRREMQRPEAHRLAAFAAGQPTEQGNRSNLGASQDSLLMRGRGCSFPHGDLVRRLLRIPGHGLDTI